MMMDTSRFRRRRRPNKSNHKGRNQKFHEITFGARMESGSKRL